MSQRPTLMFVGPSDTVLTKDLNHMLPKIIGFILGLTALAIVAWKLKKTPLCSP
jgi:hypothetical protein